MCGSLLNFGGCKVPCSRGALPGPVLPNYYNWNNGAGFPDPVPASETARYDGANQSAPTESIDSPGGQIDDGDEQSNRDPDSEQTQKSSDAESAELDTAAPPKSIASFIRAVSFSKVDEVESTRLQKDTPAAETGTAGSPSNLGVNDDRSGVAFVREAETVSLAMIESSSDQSNGLTPLNFSPNDVDFGIEILETSACLPVSAFYNDPYLLSLISQALVGNQELRILSEEIQIAQNESYARSGAYRPFVTLGARAGVEKPGRHTRQGAVEDQLQVAPGKRFPDPLPDFLVAADISWELDIWHALRNSQRAAVLRYLGTTEGRTFTVTRIVADIAENYYELLALDSRLTILNQTIDIQLRSLEVSKAKKEAGRGTELAVQRFQAEVQKNQSERSLIQQEITESENRINFLVGRYPQIIERPSVDYLDLNLNTLRAGIPSQLLSTRADIRQAEREVQAAGLDVQVARAQFYPALVIDSGVGWNAFSTGYLFRTPESLIYSAFGNLVGPLINKRAIKAEYASANAAQLQSIYNYQQTILEAHIEVVNEISKVENLRNSIEVKKQQLASLQASVDTATKLFQNARAEYVEVLLAQRELMEARMAIIDTKQEQLGGIVGAYQALGGGGF